MAAMGSKKGVSTCEAKGVARADAAWLFRRGFGAGCEICTLYSAGSSERVGRCITGEEVEVRQVNSENLGF